MIDRVASGSETWRVGVLFSRSGLMAITETEHFLGTALAIQEINQSGGILEREIEVVAYDPGSDPEIYRKMADRLLTEDGISVIFGCSTSAQRKAVLPAIERRNGLLWYPSLYEGFEYSPNVIYTGASPNQNSFPLAEYLVRHYGKRVFLVGSDYVYPRESNRIMRDLITSYGGVIAGELYVPMEASPAELQAVLARVKEQQPDVLFSTVVGQSTAIFYEAYWRAGFDPNKMPIASLTTSEAEVAEMNPEAAEGHITAAPFFEALATPAARRFINAYKQRYGANAPVTAGAEAAYFQVHLAAAALARAGTDDPEQLLPAVRDAEFDAPQGRVRIDASNNHTYLWPRVAKLDAKGTFQIVWNPGVRVKPDPYCVVMSLDDWSADRPQQIHA